MWFDVMHRKTQVSFDLKDSLVLLEFTSLGEFLLSSLGQPRVSIAEVCSGNTSFGILFYLSLRQHGKPFSFLHRRYCILWSY